MAPSSRIELITIGDELLLGFTADTNAAYLSRELADIGFDVVRRTTVGDIGPAITAAVRDALDRTGAVITTGGLGPTADDVTKPAIAEVFGRVMRFEPAILSAIEERWRARGLSGPLPAPNRRQAFVPEGARVLVNRHGSAPGIWLEDERRRWVAMLPGVPREMRGLLADELLPALRARGGESGTVVRSRTLRTTGIAESALAEVLGDLAEAVNGLPLAYLPGADGVDLRLTSRGLAPGDADNALELGVEQLRARVGPWVYGDGTTNLAAVVLDLCRARGLHVAVGESCTGGLFGARLTAVPGSSDVFVGGVIAYDNTVKVGLLGVSGDELATHGAVSEPVVRRMAEGARIQAGAQLGVGITGIAGPDGGTADKPVGTTWIALAGAGDTRAKRSVFVGDREEIRWRATQSALDMIRRALAQ
jgi:competence/damage-inducible protein CinA-like protein